MGASYRISGNVLVLSTEEHFTTEHLIEALQRARSDPAWHPPMRVLHDIRRSKEAASASEIRRRAELFVASQNLFNPRGAIVVSDLLHFGLAREGVAYAETDACAIRVFYDFDEAMAWLVEEPHDPSGTNRS